MKKMTIFRFVRNPKNYGEILGKETLRVINVHDSFVGIGEKGQVNKSEFRKLADCLEPYNDGISLS
jgi:hypothetical protein